MIAARPGRAEGSFRHEALLYAGEDSFLSSTTAFITEGLEAEEPVLVVVSSAKIKALRAQFDRDADRIQFADMAELGRNPARIIPAWRDFVNQQADGHQRVRGIGEPIWADRTRAEIVESQHHESLLNVAFAESPAWSLLCPYDTETLEPAVVEEARRSHPFVAEGGVHQNSAVYRGLDAAAAVLDQPLPQPPAAADELVVRAGALRALRGFASRHAVNAGLSPERTAAFVFSINELATNSVRHAGGEVTVSAWQDADELIGEVRDQGRISQPLVGRERPTPGQEDGRGLWLVNQLCELVQVRSFPTGTLVRVHMRRV